MFARPFRYLADPVCVGSLVLFAINRFYWKPHHIGGWFTHGYLNDVLCLPLFLPIILRGQTVLRLRAHDGPPRMWEVLQHWIIFSVVFEVVLPRFPQTFDTIADPFDVVAYLVGGAIAYCCWHCRRVKIPSFGVRFRLCVPDSVTSVANAAVKTAG
jgi:hypothetical protein